MDPATPLRYPRSSLGGQALSAHFARAEKASLSMALKLKAVPPVWDQFWEVDDHLSASQKQRVRSTTETPVSRAPCGSGRTIPSRSSATRVVAKQEDDHDEDLVIADHAFKDIDCCNVLSRLQVCCPCGAGAGCMRQQLLCRSPLQPGSVCGCVPRLPRQIGPPTPSATLWHS